MTEFHALVADINKANGNGAPAHDERDWLRKELLPTIGRFVSAQVKPLQRRIEDLERKIENWKYVGVYESGVTYLAGNFATHDGSLFHCQRDTCTPPGTTDEWQLCCKRGRNGKSHDDRR